jgi:hypothetical protein
MAAMTTPSAAASSGQRRREGDGSELDILLLPRESR